MREKANPYFICSFNVCRINCLTAGVNCASTSVLSMRRLRLSTKEAKTPGKAGQLFERRTALCYPEAISLVQRLRVVRSCPLLVGEVVAIVEGGRLQVEDGGDEDDPVQGDAVLPQMFGKTGAAEGPVAFSHQEKGRHSSSRCGSGTV